MRLFHSPFRFGSLFWGVIELKGTMHSRASGEWVFACGLEPLEPAFLHFRFHGSVVGGLCRQRSAFTCGMCACVMDSPCREGIKVAARSFLAQRNMGTGPTKEHQNEKVGLIAIRDDRGRADHRAAPPLPHNPLISLRAFNRFGFTTSPAHLSR